jgi:hypothetical protein
LLLQLTLQNKDFTLKGLNQLARWLIVFSQMKLPLSIAAIPFQGPSRGVVGLEIA